MAADTGYQERDENRQQSSRTDRGDRERTIQTGREEGRSTGISRRQPTTPTYGFGRGQLSPFSMMRRMAEDMDRLFENFGLSRSSVGLQSLASNIEQTIWAPQVETFRRGDNLVIRADLPGLKKEDVKVEIDDGVLAISGERREEREEARDDYFQSERSYGQFYRVIPLPEGVNENQSEASFRDGVLEVTIPAPKQEERKARKIAVK